MDIRTATLDQVSTIRSLAEQIWPVSYAGIISEDQITYMLELMYNADELRNQMLHKNVHFKLIYQNNQPVGFTGYGPKDSMDADVWRLHKLYVLPQVKGKGFGAALLKEVENDALLEGAHFLELNVNKQNPAFQFYLHHQFEVIKETVLQIGNGYVMDDYIMRKKLSRS